MDTHRNTYKDVSKYKYISFLYLLIGPRSDDTVVTNTRFSNKTNQGFLEKCLIIGLGQELYKKS